MSPVTVNPLYCLRCFPRVSGDEPHTPPAQPALIAFSPRERG